MKEILKKTFAGIVSVDVRLAGSRPALWTLLLVAGCQNSLKVKVELMVPTKDVDTSAVAPSTFDNSAKVQDRVVRGIAAVRAAVSTIETGVDQAKKALVSLGYQEAAIEGGQFPSLAILSKACASARMELDKRVPGVTVDTVSSISALEIQLRTEVSRGLEGFKRLKRELARRAAPEGDADYSTRLEAALGALSSLEKTAAESATAVATAGFGGFEVLGIYELNQADPAYREVLDRNKYRTVGLFSMAEAKVNGDSTIVIVQENPGQFRVFEIDNDPAKLIQNVAYISHKALEAAVKYSAP